MQNQTVEIPYFKGLNSSHTRDKTEVSNVKNAIFSNGTIRSRGSFINLNINSRFISVTNKGGLMTSQTRINSPVFFGNKVYCVSSGNLSTYQSDMVLNAFNGFSFKKYKIGETEIDESKIYFIPQRIEKILIFSGDIFFCFIEGEPTKIYFNSRYATSGETFEEMEKAFKISNPLYWKINDYINVQGNIIDIVAIQTHLYIVTDIGCYRFVGENANNFSLTFANSISGVMNNVGVVINDNYYYRSKDNNFYRYSGTTPTVISYAIKEELDELKNRPCKLEKCGTDLWIIFDSATYVYDTLVGTFTRFIFTTKFIDTASYGEKLYVTVGETSPKVYIYDKSSKLGKDDFSTSRFQTSFAIGYFDLEGRILRLKNVLVNIEEKSLNQISTVSGTTYSSTLKCIGYSDSVAQQVFTPESKIYSVNQNAYIKKNNRPMFYLFKSRLKGRTLSIVFNADFYIEEIQKIVLQLRVRGR